MKRPTVLHVEDEDRIEALQKRMGAKSRLDVVREALSRLEHALENEEPTDVGTSSEEVLYAFHDSVEP